MYGRAACEDLAQEVLMQLAESELDPGDDGRVLGAWVRQAVDHVVIDHGRRHRVAERRSVDRESRLLRGETVLDPRPGSPTRDARRRERVEALWSALERLSGPYRDVLIHRFIEGRSLAETARLLQKSEGAVSVQQNRALQRLREVYSGAEPTA